MNENIVGLIRRAPGNKIDVTVLSYMAIIKRVCLSVAALVSLIFGFSLVSLVLLLVILYDSNRLEKKRLATAHNEDLDSDSSSEWIRDPTNVRYPVGEYSPRSDWRGT